MISIGVKSDIQKAIKALDDIQQKQVPFATAKALTDTAKDVQDALQKQLEKDIDRPTPFTKRAFYLQRATKTNLMAVVGIKEAQDKYLSVQITGGVGRPARKALIKPADIKLNQYGNLPKGKVKALLQRPDMFSGTVNGVPGIWQRINKKGKHSIKLLVRYKSEQRYKPRFKFFDVAEDTARKVFVSNFETALSFALQTAK